MIEIMICDDDYNFIKQTEEVLYDCINCSPFADLNYTIRVTTSSYELMKIADSYSPDILILDIHMPEINGLEIAEKFHDNKVKTKIIFLTNYEQFVFYSLRFSPFRFIRKTAMSKELPEAIESALKSILGSVKNLTIKRYSDYQVIPLNTIKYIEKAKYKNSVNIVCCNETVEYRETISVLDKKLEGNGFVKINSGTLVNLRYIKKIEGQDVILTDYNILRISQSNIEIIKKEFAKYIRHDI